MITFIRHFLLVVPVPTVRSRPIPVSMNFYLPIRLASVKIINHFADIP